MNNKIRWFGGDTKNDVPADTVIEFAKGEYSDVIIIGWHKDDGELEVKYSSMQKQEILWLLEVAKNELLKSKPEGE
jgi:hypothetical protein